MIVGKSNGIDWGGLFNTGVKVLQENLFKKTTGPVAVVQKANDHTPVKSGVPAWVIPAAIAAAVLLLGKKLFR